MSTVAPVSNDPALAEISEPVPRRTWQSTLRRNWAALVLAVIIMTGGAARLAGVRWGLPLQLHPDEYVIVQGAMDMARRHSFEPGFFYRPDHVEMQLSNIAYLVYSHLLHGSSPEKLYATSQAAFYLISRLITFCFGIGMIVLAYRIGVRFNRAIGLIAAFLVAFFPPFVVNSHFATPDIPLSFALMVVILGCMRYLTLASWRNLLLASLGVSIAIAIKYPGALGAIMIAITVIISGVQARDWRRILVHGAGAVGAVIGFLFLISPVLFTDAPAVLQNLSDQAGGGHLGADGLGWSGNVGFYAADFATSAGIVLVMCFALGILWSGRLRLGQSVPLWTGAIVWLFLSSLGLHWDRWGLPMYLTPLLLASIGIYHSAKYLLAKRVAAWLRWLVVTVVALMVANLLIGSVAVAAEYAATDTRSFGADDFAARHLDVTNTIFEGYTPLLPGASKFIFNAFDVVDGRLTLSPKDKNRANFRYVVVSSFLYGRFDTDPTYAVQQRFYRLLAQQYPLVKTYTPVPEAAPTIFAAAGIWRSVAYVAGIARGGLSGPTIKVYEIPADRR